MLRVALATQCISIRTNKSSAIIMGNFKAFPIGKNRKARKMKKAFFIFVILMIPSFMLAEEALHLFQSETQRLKALAHFSKTKQMVKDLEIQSHVVINDNKHSKLEIMINDNHAYSFNLISVKGNINGGVYFHFRNNKTANKVDFSGLKKVITTRLDDLFPENNSVSKNLIRVTSEHVTHVELIQILRRKLEHKIIRWNTSFFKKTSCGPLTLISKFINTYPKRIKTIEAKLGSTWVEQSVSIEYLSDYQSHEIWESMHEEIKAEVYEISVYNVHQHYILSLFEKLYTGMHPLLRLKKDSGFEYEKSESHLNCHVYGSKEVVIYVLLTELQHTYHAIWKEEYTKILSKQESMETLEEFIIDQFGEEKSITKVSLTPDDDQYDLNIHYHNQ